MQFFENYRREYKVISATIASILTTFLIDKFANQFKSDALAYSTIIVAVILIVLIGNYLIDYLIDNSVKVRKLLMGKDFIEGYWYDVSFDKTTNVIKHSVLFKIDFEKEQYVLHGVSYSSQGERIATWKSTSCTYFDRVLFVQYESHTELAEAFIEHGVLQMQFETPPNSYTGFYLDLANSVRSIISGKRVTDEELKANHNFNDITNKEEFLIAVMQKQEATMQARK